MKKDKTVLDQDSDDSFLDRDVSGDAFMVDGVRVPYVEYLAALAASRTPEEQAEWERNLPVIPRKQRD